ncbi:MAG: SGNH/GDSL hydrolase family protein [Ilumatobacteraceae bacterium]
MGRARRAVVAVFAVILVSGCGADTKNAGPSSAPTATPTSTSVTAAATTTTAPRPLPRVLLIGDSTLLAVDRYNAYRALLGFDYVYDAESCRTLGIPSCGRKPLPPNAVEAIGAADGSFDYVVVMAGYDEWWTSFPDSFDEVVDAARAKGAHRVIWLTYREGVPYKLLTGEPADEAFIKNNQTLREKVTSGAFPDVLLANWYPHVPADNGWLSDDGIHLTADGAFGVADYISRFVAYAEGRPCPMPAVPDGALEPTCPSPDGQPPINDVRALYRK